MSVTRVMLFGVSVVLLLIVCIDTKSGSNTSTVSADKYLRCDYQGCLVVNKPKPIQHLYSGSDTMNSGS